MQQSLKQEIGERREVKKLLKNYRDKHLPTKLGKRFGCSLLSSLPFGNEKGQKLLHRVNQSRISESDSNDEDRLDLLKRAINIKKVLKGNDKHEKRDALLKKISGLEEISDDDKTEFDLVSFNQDEPVCKRIFENCQELEIDTIVLDRFIKNAILKSLDEHDTSINTEEKYFEKLAGSGLFKIEGDDVTFDLEALEKNEEMKKAFMNSLEECLLFDYVEKLKYEQYGLNDFYWALDKQNQKQAHSHGHKHHKHHHHKHSHDHHRHDHSHSCADEEDHKAKKHDHSHHEPLCRPCHLPSAHQSKKSVAKHDHHHEHHNHEHHPASDSRASAEDQKSVMPETEQKLLSEFKSLTTKKISSDKKERQKQVTEQNKVIDQVLKKSREFVLESKVKNREKNQTIFTYLDPDHQNSDDPDYKEKQVIYIQDDSTGKIDVLYGTKARALVIERPNQVKNGVITKIDEKKVEHYGKISDGSTFKSFQKADLSKGSPNGGLRQARSQSLNERAVNINGKVP